MKMFDDFPYTDCTSTNHYNKLERLKNEILSTKVEVHNKIIQYRIWLDEKESDILREFDQIYHELDSMLTLHYGEIADLERKLRLINESFEIDFVGFAKGKDYIAIQDKLQELSNKTFQIPSLQVKWDDEEFHAKIHTLCRLTTRLPPYQERNIPIWGGVSKENDYSPVWGPVSIATHPISEDIFVTEAKQNRIQIYSKNGKLQSSLKDKHLKHPWYICLSNTHLYVSCFHSNTIHKFNLASRKKQAIVQSPNLLSGLTIGRNSVYACVCEDSEIIEYDMNLKKLQTIKLNIQKGVKIYDIKFVDDKFYIVTDGSYTIQVFSKTGEAIDRLIPNYSVGRICHFDIDRQMSFILTDTNDHQIKIFSQKGKLIHTLGKKGNRAGELMYPEGVVLDKNERILVWDFKESNRLQMF